MSQAASASVQESPVIETALGKLRGATVDGVNIFKGVHYAQAARFRPPQPVAAWPGIRDALALGPSTPQPKRAAEVPWWDWITGRQPQSEDCLVLNVFAPTSASGRKLPVMFYLHGGGFTTGSASAPGVDGTELARRGDVVVVSINHRLNLFGFLYLAELAGPDYADSGNVGMLDCVAALQWVRQNISAFGGDPDNVTIFGQSGGASKVAVLMAAPAAHGLFHKAIIQSASSLIRMVMPEAATASAKALCDAVGATANKLRDVPVDALLAARLTVVAKAGGSDPWRPVMDGRFLPTHPFDPAAPALSKQLPLIIGTADTEQTFFLGASDRNFSLQRGEAIARIARFIGVADGEAARLYENYRASHISASPSEIMAYVMSDQMYRRNDTLAADLRARQGGAPTYSYVITWRSPAMGGKLMSPHTVCIPFVFGTLGAAAPMIGSGAAQAALSAKMMGAWTSFARSGVPTASGLPAWTPYNADTRPTMVFDDDCRVENDPRQADRLALARYPLYAPEDSARRD
jgi:para-nitrobenzyl esterase